MRIFSALFLMTIFMIAPYMLFAQLPGLPDPPNQAPIDGGLGLLVAAGGTYVIRKLLKKNRDLDNMEN